MQLIVTCDYIVHPAHYYFYYYRL